MISQKEIKQLAGLLKKIDNPHEGLPQPVFDALVNVVPFVACEVIIINDKKGVLMTWRDDKWWRGWHFPGGLLRFRECFEERIEQVAWQELGINISTFEFLFIKNHEQCARGHAVSLVFLCQTEMKPKTGRFFKKMPKNIVDGTEEMWEYLKQTKKFKNLLK